MKSVPRWRAVLKRGSPKWVRWTARCVWTFAESTKYSSAPQGFPASGNRRSAHSARRRSSFHFAGNGNGQVGWCLLWDGNYCRKNTSGGSRRIRPEKPTTQLFEEGLSSVLEQVGGILHFDLVPVHLLLTFDAVGRPRHCIYAFGRDIFFVM